MRHLAMALMVMHLAASAAPAQDRDRPEASSKSVEITPYVSLGSVQSSIFGAALTFPWTASLGVETEVGYRRGEVNGIAADVSLTYSLPRMKGIVPYVAGGIGLHEYGVPVPATNGVLFTQSKMALAVNAGGGVKVPVNRRWSFRSDARWFNGFGASAPEHWRLFSGVTVRSLGGHANAGEPPRK